MFDRTSRWITVRLLDESNAFALERGADLARNAIVAELPARVSKYGGFDQGHRATTLADRVVHRFEREIMSKEPPRMW
ncbi:hypothetical protein GCM10010489_21720 [Microbacterium saperdae]|nr:hypothetical protein GCM10010489_21720 [Microbacterium saperdae]